MAVHRRLIAVRLASNRFARWLRGTPNALNSTSRFFVIRKFQGIVGRAYIGVRQKVGDMLGAISEAVVGAATIRAYGVEDRTAERIDVAVDDHRRAAIGAQARAVIAFTSGQLVSGADDRGGHRRRHGARGERHAHAR